VSEQQAAGGRAALDVHLVTPEREVWAGDATFVSVQTVEGSLGVLPGHEPLAATLRVGPLHIDPVGGQRVAAAIDGGFLHVTTGGTSTRVDVLAEFAVLADELDPAELRELEEQIAALHASNRDEEARELEDKLRARTALTADANH
jgi:F-type H+-transporting ATPase subunit epsilon